MKAQQPDQTTDYARRVVAGEIVCGKLVRLAAERHLRDLQTAGERGFVFDVEAAERAIAFFSTLQHYKGKWAGKPLSLSPWQCFIVGSILGWKHKATGLRRFREAYEEVPRKNGKSTKDAGLALLLTFFDGEPGSEGYCAATKKDQARIIFGDAKRMALKASGLRKRLQIFTNNISHVKSSSKLTPLGADEDTMDGLNVHAAFMDEVHKYKTSGIVDVLKTATGAREQPLVKYVTTAGYDRHSVCWQLHDYSVKVLEGIVEDDTFFAFVACADPGDDWRQPATWAKANPNLGVSVHLEDLQRKANKAEHVPADQNAFRRLHLNEWTEQSERWIDLAVWDRGNVPVSPRLLELPCFGGLDLASVEDIAAFLKLFGPDAEGFYDVVCRFWVPAEGIAARAKRDRVPYDIWAQQGFITPTPGNVTDYDQIEAAVVDDAHEFDILEVGYDPWNATQLVTHIGEQLAGREVMVPIRQGVQSMGEPTKALQRILLDGKLRHGGNPVLRWMAGNVSVSQDANGNFKPDRKKSQEKIDGIIALVMALARSTVRKEKPRPRLDFIGGQEDATP